MRNLKASEIIEAMKIFSEKCKKLDNLRDELLNMFASLSQRILKDIEKIKEEENTQNIGKKECSEQDEEQEERVFMHVEAEKLMCPFGEDCIAYQVFDLVDRKEFCRTGTAKRCRECWEEDK